MRCVYLTIISCAVLAVASDNVDELEAASCRLNITVEMTLERYARKLPRGRGNDYLSWVTETSRPNGTTPNCQYWLNIDNSSVCGINKNSFDNLMIDGLEISAESDVLLLTPGSFNGLPSLRHLTIRPPVLLTATPLPEHQTDHKIYQGTMNVTSLEYGSNNRITFRKMLKEFPKLERLIINFVPRLKTQPKSYLSSAIFSDVSTTVKYLEFTNSQMLTLVLKPFSYFNNLTHLKFNNMGLIHLNPLNFHGLDNLEYLSFTTLYSFHISKQVFSPLKKLKTLIIRGCVSSIETKAFENLKVELIDLSCNKLFIIKEKIFSKIEATHFDLSFNEIKKIYNNAFANSNINYLYLWKTGLNDTHVDKSSWGLSESTQIIFDRPSNHSLPGRETCPPEKPFEYN